MHKQATPNHPIHELIARRWSPYAFSDRPVSDDDLRSLFEAARWAASSYNEQPWSYILATKGNPAEFERLLSCLVEGNQAWAKAAPVLAIGCTNLNFVRNGKPNAAAIHDLGLASATLTFEATARGLFVHQMIGIVPERVRELYRVPEGVQPLTGLAIGYVADPNVLPEVYRQRDLAPRQRKRLAEFVFGGQWGTSADLSRSGATPVSDGRQAVMIKPNEGRRIGVAGDVYRFLGTQENTCGRYAILEATILPGGGPPLHVHSREDEGFYVLEGEITFRVEDQTMIGTAGTFVNLPPGVRHCFKNESQTTSRMLILVSPAGLERMFQETGVVLNDDDELAPPLSAEEIERLMNAAPRYGITIFPPNPPAQPA